MDGVRDVARHRWRHRLGARLSGIERRTLLMILAVAITSLGFAELTDEVLEGETHGFDERVLIALRAPGDLSDPIGPAWFEESMRDVTALGSMVVLLLVTAAITGYLILDGQRRTALVLAVAVVGGTALNNALKWGFDRPRPELVPHGTEVYTQSFPSGHAMLSAIVWLTLGAMVARVQRHAAAKVYVLVVAVTITALVGFSRVYLGVHWPTDILAGWAVGAAWALLCWLVLVQVQRRTPEPQSSGSPLS